MYFIRVLFMCFLNLLSCVCYAGNEMPRTKHVLQMSLRDSFTVANTDDWKVDVQKLLPLRFANVKVTPRIGASFSMMLYFKCDTPDLARFNSPAKIEKVVLASSKKYLSNATEKEVKLKQLDAHGWYGCYTVLTDARWANAKNIPKGEFRYITRGMIRLSPDSALGLSIMSNELDTKEYKKLIDYIRNFTNEGFVEAR